MNSYRITACGARDEEWNILPVGFAVRRCRMGPDVPCTPPCAGARECPHFNRDCKEVAYFGIARHGKYEAWQMAVNKVRELNPRGDIAQGRRYPTLQNLSGKQQEIANDF